MDAATYQEIRRHFEALLELTEGERISALEGLDVTDEVRAELRARLDFEPGMAAFTEEHLGEAWKDVAVAAGADTATSNHELPERIGSYAVESVLGVGGMGVVYLAQQDSPRRKVAIKVLRRLLVDARARRRFEREAEFLGQLQHPGIAQVIEAGRIEDDTGTDFIALEYVEGAAINDFANTEGLGLRQRIGLLIDLCRAVQHAHSFGIVHRDLKPSNVLVTHAGQIKVIDFGIARAVGGDVSLTAATEVGQVIGTLNYMSPEQVLGDSTQIDARTDVYSIGVIAYELLGGSAPYDLRSASLAEAVERLQHQRVLPLGRVAAECRGDVELIASKALESERDRRYQSAVELAADLQRFLDSEPIHARPASAIYQLTRLARRHRGVVVATAMMLLAILVGAGAAVRQAIVNGRLAEEANAATEEAHAATREARLASDDALAAKDLAERRLEELAARTEELSDVVAFQERVLHNIDAVSVGVLLREGLRDDILGSLEGQGATGVELDQAAADLDNLTRHLDATGLATRVVDRAMLTPTREQVEQLFQSQPRVRAKLLAALARNRSNLRLPNAEAAFRSALQAATEALGPDSALVYELEVQIGSQLVIYSAGDAGVTAEDLEEARVLLEHGLEGLDRLDSSPMTQEIGRASLARCYSTSGDTERAREILEELVARATEGQATAGTFIAMRRLGKMYALKRDLDEAIQLYRRAIEGFASLGEQEHNGAIQTLYDLGESLAVAQRFEESESYLNRALDLGRKIEGDRSQVALLSAGMLGLIYYSQGRYEDALEPFRFAVDITRTAFPIEDGLRALRRFANTQHQLEDFRGLETSAREGLERARRAFGPEHEQTAEFYDRLITALEGQAASGADVDLAELSELKGLLERARED